LNIAIIVVIEAYAGIGIINYELIAEIHDVSPGVFRIARLNGRRDGCTQQYEENRNYLPRVGWSGVGCLGGGYCQGVADGGESAAAVSAAGFDN
jgi:hypothetical protein